MPLNPTTQAVPMPRPSLERQLLNIVPHPALQFETHLVEHCNLNCQMCTHFSPLARPMFTEIGVFSRDMRRLQELFRSAVSYVMLLGGEPLLHPQVSDFLEITRTFFPHAEVILYTNGLKIPQMNEGFWRSCQRNDITITLTRYPISADYSRIDELIEEHRIPYRYCNTPGRSKKSSHYPLDPLGRQDPRQNFLACDMANRCIFLKDGRLYTCALIPNICHFNEYFHKNLEVSLQDSIDIYQAGSGAEIMRFLASPPPFCRYCNVQQRTILHEWAQSRKDIQEWT